MPRDFDQPDPLFAARYRVEQQIGEGGMATVYRALDLKHGRRVALKVLKPELSASVGVERFQREIMTTASLRHPHILPLYDSGQVTGPDGDALLCYVMPFVEGESLRDRLTRERQLPLDDARRIARMVADFGIARALSAAGATILTQPGMAVGFPMYMSPEQSVGDEVDGRGDRYALGCVLYEMLAGEPPYTGATAQAIIAKRFRDPVPRVSTLRESVPRTVETALQTVMARSPSDRFATAQAFVAALAVDVARQSRLPPRWMSSGSRCSPSGIRWATTRSRCSPMA
ncbi:serine/threonine-protein kinase [Gemmatimonas sp.]|uniref:serine/threonine-protein kinase n=1 Tax=Gemmatimonas sp. TaxID=1962908 RepID=UPI003982D855